jgi:hypothetical protein
VPRRDPVDGIGIVRDADAVASQLLAESYRPGTGRQRRLVQCGDPPGQLLRPVDRRIPGSFPASVVKSSKDLPAPAVEDSERRAPVRHLRDPPPESVERADAPCRQPEADRETAGGGDPDPDAGEGAGAEPDREQVDLPPAAGRRGGPLDLRQQPGRMPWPPLRREAELRLVEQVAFAPGAGDGVDRRGVEADDEQGRATP